MRAAALLVLLAAVPAGADTVSDATKRELGRLEARMASSAAARALLAATRATPRRETRGSGLPETIAYSARSGAFVYDGERLPGTTESDAVVELALAMARAELAFPVVVVELEQAAWQKTLLFCVEFGAEDAAFGRRLAAAADAARRRQTALERSEAPRRSPWEASETPLLRAPEGALAKAGYYLALYEKDPLAFYWAVEAGTAWPKDAVRLTELQDFVALRGSELAAMKSAPEGPYAMVGGRRYGGALTRAALRLRGSGGLERLVETLGAFDTVGLADLRVAVNRWRRSVR